MNDQPAKKKKEEEEVKHAHCTLQKWSCINLNLCVREHYFFLTSSRTYMNMHA